jgi:hypothetical protein
MAEITLVRESARRGRRRMRLARSRFFSLIPNLKPQLRNSSAFTRVRARLRPSRGFPVGFATTHEPNGNAASCSDCNRRQTDWIRSLVFQTQPGLTLVSGHTKARYESDRGGSFVGSSVLVEAAGKPRHRQSLALPRRDKVDKNISCPLPPTASQPSHF